uniref:Protein BZR1 homolog n=1 Tax=Oryza meridionalis TaxID=40149 RepID=A0A0E0CIE2_9ORYZ
MMNGGGGGRVPTWRERENNRRRERRRRAIAAKIYAGLRAYGNYTLPKHCDNNEVLKALCNEAGWTVEPDGTTYRKGCKPPASELADQLGRSPSASPCSSYQPSPRGTSSFPSSGSSSQITLGGGGGGGGEGSSLIPWLKTLSSAGVGIGGGSSSKFPAHYSYFGGGSISAPVTPPSGSPPRTPRLKTAAWEEYHHHAGSVLPPWATVDASYAYAASSLPNSTPPSPRRKVAAAAAAAAGGNDAAAWLAGFQISSAGPSSPTYSLVAPPPNPFGAAAAAAGSSSRVMSGACSPVAGGDVQMADVARREFAFGGEGKMTGLVKAWEGERIHEECGSDDLELTLGSSMTRGDR